MPEIYGVAAGAFVKSGKGTEFVRCLFIANEKQKKERDDDAHKGQDEHAPRPRPYELQPRVNNRSRAA